MSEISGKRRKRYVDNLKDRSKLTCLVHGPGNSSDGCKVLGDFGYKYSERIPTKYHGHEPTTNKQFDINQENNHIVWHTVDEIILNENKTLRAEAEAQENIDSEIYKKDLYGIYNMSLDQNK